MTLKIIIGQDVGAYATVYMPDNTDLSHDNLKKIANHAIENEVFQPEYETVHQLRIVGVYDDQGKAIIQDANLEVEPSAGRHWLQIVYGGLEPALHGPYQDWGEVLVHAKAHRINADPSRKDGLYYLKFDEKDQLQVGTFSNCELEVDNDV